MPTLLKCLLYAALYLAIATAETTPSRLDRRTLTDGSNGNNGLSTPSTNGRDTASRSKVKNALAFFTRKRLRGSDGSYLRTQSTKMPAIPTSDIKRVELLQQKSLSDLEDFPSEASLPSSTHQNGDGQTDPPLTFRRLLRQKLSEHQKEKQRMSQHRLAKALERSRYQQLQAVKNVPSKEVRRTYNQVLGLQRISQQNHEDATTRAIESGQDMAASAGEMGLASMHLRHERERELAGLGFAGLPKRRQRQIQEQMLGSGSQDQSIV